MELPIADDQDPIIDQLVGTPEEELMEPLSASDQDPLSDPLTGTPEDDLGSPGDQDPPVDLLDGTTEVAVDGGSDRTETSSSTLDADRLPDVLPDPPTNVSSTDSAPSTGLVVPAAEALLSEDSNDPIEPTGEAVSTPDLDTSLDVDTGLLVDVNAPDVDMVPDEVALATDWEDELFVPVVSSPELADPSPPSDNGLEDGPSGLGAPHDDAYDADGDSAGEEEAAARPPLDLAPAPDGAGASSDSAAVTADSPDSDCSGGESSRPPALRRSARPRLGRKMLVYDKKGEPRIQRYPFIYCVEAALATGSSPPPSCQVPPSSSKSRLRPVSQKLGTTTSTTWHSSSSSSEQQHPSTIHHPSITPQHISHHITTATVTDIEHPASTTQTSHHTPLT